MVGSRDNDRLRLCRLAVMVIWVTAVDAQLGNTCDRQFDGERLMLTSGARSLVLSCAS